MMPSELDLVVTPANGWSDTDERRFHEEANRRSAQSQGSVSSISRYTGIADLIAKINQAMQSDPDHPCLRTLEIMAHGSPTGIDDFPIHDAGSWGTQLMTLNWCDVASIYLSGCNTGVPRPRGLTPRGPVAEELRDSMRFRSGSFEVRLTIYGSAGYLTGARTWGNSSVRSSFSTGVLLWREDHEAFPGSRDASGNDAWNAFQNW